MSSTSNGLPPPWFRLPDPDLEASSVTIIGAGLAGSATAHHLAESGISVTVLDQNPTIAGGASGNPAGLFKSQVNSQNNLISSYYSIHYQYFTEYIKILLKESKNIECRFSGINLLEFSLNNVQQKLIEDAGIISPVTLCAAQLQHVNIKVKTNAAVDSIHFDKSHWHCLDVSGQTLACSRTLVLANGHQANAFKQTLPLELSPLSGQISFLKSDAISPPVKSPYSGKHYLIPLHDGGYVCGASHHRTAHLPVNQTDHEQNIAGLKAMLPKHTVDSLKVSGGRTGVRCVTPDHLPMVGAIPDRDYFKTHYDSLHHGRKASAFPDAHYLKGLFVISGLGSHGIASSPYLGKLLSEMINKTPGSSDTEVATLLHPARFLIRELHKKPVDRKFADTLR